MAKLRADLVDTKLREFSGNLAAVARAFGCTRQAVQSFIASRPSLQAVTKDCRESFKDNAESALQRAVIAGEPWAVCFYLKCQAKDRGYVERQELTGAEGAPLVQAIAGIDAPAALGQRISEPSTNGANH